MHNPCPHRGRLRRVLRYMTSFGDNSPVMLSSACAAAKRILPNTSSKSGKSAGSASFAPPGATAPIASTTETITWGVWKFAERAGGQGECFLDSDKDPRAPIAEAAACCTLESESCKSGASTGTLSSVYSGPKHTNCLSCGTAILPVVSSKKELYSVGSAAESKHQGNCLG